MGDFKITDTQSYTITGKVLYASILQPRPGYGGKALEYQIEVEPSEVDISNLIAIGVDMEVFNPTTRKMQPALRNVVLNKTTGEVSQGKYMKFKRKAHIIIDKDTGDKLIAYALPVTHAATGAEVTEEVGNGSICEVDITQESFSCKDTKGVPMTGSRTVLSAVRVIELVPLVKQALTLKKLLIDSPRVDLGTVEHGDKI